MMDLRKISDLHLAEQMLKDNRRAEQVLRSKMVRTNLAQARRSLKELGRIGYNTLEEVWYFKETREHALTEKEKSYLHARGLGEGWTRIPEKLDAIKWLHANLTPDEFENFCCAILTYSSVLNLSVSEKRQGSHADGGVDGRGEYWIDGKTERIVFEAKRYALTEQIGTDICQKLIGAMMGEKVKYGFIVTTGQFSDRTRSYVEKMRMDYDIMIELIDQDRLADIMLCRKDAPHGLGLHRTDIGLIYMNTDILRRSVTR